MQIERLGAQDIVARMPGLIATELEGRQVMMNIDSGKYYLLDGIGSRIWELLESPRSIGSIAEALVAEYEVAPADCLADLLRFFGKMTREGLIAVES